MSVVIFTADGSSLSEDEERELREKLAPLIQAIQNGANPQDISDMLASDDEMLASDMFDFEELTPEQEAAIMEQMAINARGGQKYLH